MKKRPGDKKTRDLLYEVKDRDTISNGAEEGVSIWSEENVALPVHCPTDV
jgi:hypothetical protein